MLKTPTNDDFKECLERETLNLTTKIDVSKLTVEDATNLTLVNVSKVTVKDVIKLQKAMDHCAVPQKRFASKAETDYESCFAQETSELNISNTLADQSKFLKAMDHCTGQARIIGGQQIAYREYPWIVS